MRTRTDRWTRRLRCWPRPRPSARRVRGGCRCRAYGRRRRWGPLAKIAQGWPKFRDLGTWPNTLIANLYGIRAFQSAHNLGQRCTDLVVRAPLSLCISFAMIHTQTAATQVGLTPRPAASRGRRDPRGCCAMAWRPPPSAAGCQHSRRTHGALRGGHALRTHAPRPHAARWHAHAGCVIGTEYVSKPGLKRVSGGARRQCDQPHARSCGPCCSHMRGLVIWLRVRWLQPDGRGLSRLPSAPTMIA